LLGYWEAQQVRRDDIGVLSRALGITRLTVEYSSACNGLVVERRHEKQSFFVKDQQEIQKVSFFSLMQFAFLKEKDQKRPITSQ